MQRRAAPLTRPVHVDGIKRPPRPLGAPRRRQRLPAVPPRLVGWLDPAGVERQARRATESLAAVTAAATTLPRHDLSRVAATARAGPVQLKNLGAVEVRLADIPPRLAAVKVRTGRVDGGK